jgi:hypothetical protein
MKKIIIVSKDGSSFELDYELAKRSRLLESEMSRDTYNKPMEIELANIHSAVLERIVSYLVYHKEVLETSAWDNQFIKKFTGDELIDLVWSANYLKIDDLLALAKNRLIDVFENNNIRKARDMLSIQSNLTVDEDESIRNEFIWN